MVVRVLCRETLETGGAREMESEGNETRERERENPIDYSRASVKEKRWKVERKFHLLERERDL